MKTRSPRQPQKSPAKFRETKTGTLHGTEIFATGLHRGKEYTDADLDAIAANFERFSTGDQPKLAVPAVLGHEESQELLERSDLPAAAWAKRVYREGHKLKADFAEVPLSVVKLIEGKRYRKVSAEVYDEPPEGISGQGKMLRRVAFLGGEIPQIKTLADIPMPEVHAETGVKFLRFSEIKAGKNPGLFHVFAEVVSMSRQEMIEFLTQAGVDASKITDAVPDEFLASLVKAMQDEEATEPDPATMTPEDKAKLAEKYKGLAAKYGDACATKNSDASNLATHKLVPMADALPPPVHSTVPPLPGAAMGSDPSRAVPAPPSGTPQPTSTTVTHKFTEEQLRQIQDSLKPLVAACFGDIRKDIDPVKADVSKFREDMRKSRLDAVLETYKDRIAPAELDETSGLPTLRDDLLRLDATTVVHTFKEGGKAIPLTAFDLAIEKLKRRKPLKFGEFVRVGKNGKPDDSEEMEALETHFTQQAEGYEASGLTVDKFKETYKAGKKSGMFKTVEEFLTV